VAGTDFWTENSSHCGHWPGMMNLSMDLRDKDAWRMLFERDLCLVHVGQQVIKYSTSNDPEEQGTLFTFGSLPK
jgi:hypothetical protein